MVIFSGFFLLPSALLINSLSFPSKGGDADKFLFVGPLFWARFCGIDLRILLEEQNG